MRKRILRLPAALVVAAAIAAIGAGSAVAAIYWNQVVDTHNHTSAVSFDAKAIAGGWVDVLFQGSASEHSGQTWEVIIRNHNNQVIFDGPCVKGNNTNRDYVTLAKGVRMNGSRVHHFEIHECSGNTGQAIEEVVLQTTMRNVTIRNISFFNV